MQEISPQTPEQRRRKIGAGVREAIDNQLDRVGPGTRVYQVAKRTIVGVFSDGFIHAGNLAFLTLVTLFPFVIVMAALAGVFGRSEDTLRAVGGMLATLPPTVREVVRQPILDVLTARTGNLLLVGGLIGLWTVGGYIETIRDILRRAYGTEFTQAFWKYRLWSIGIIVVSVILVMISFVAQVVLTAAESFIYRLLPFAQDALTLIGFSKLIPIAVLWLALYALMWSLTPSRYRYGKYPKWPGALFVTLWWQLIIQLLPLLLYGLENYDLTYGSLAGVIIALSFFWFVGLGFVFGAHLNAALAEPRADGLDANDGAVAEAA